jgi:hypothetical protein
MIRAISLYKGSTQSAHRLQFKLRLFNFHRLIQVNFQLVLQKSLVVPAHCRHKKLLLGSFVLINHTVRFLFVNFWTQVNNFVLMVKGIETGWTVEASCPFDL